MTTILRYSVATLFLAFAVLLVPTHAVRADTFYVTGKWVGQGSALATAVNMRYTYVVNLNKSVYAANEPIQVTGSIASNVCSNAMYAGHYTATLTATPSFSTQTLTVESGRPYEAAQQDHAAVPSTLVGGSATFTGSPAGGSFTMNFEGSGNSLKTSGPFCQPHDYECLPDNPTYLVDADGNVSCLNPVDVNPDPTCTIDKQYFTTVTTTYSMPFTVLPAPPSSMSHTCSADGTSVTLSWPASAGATGYYPSMQGPTSCASGWSLSTTTANTCYQSNIAGTAITYTGITPGTTYSASVQAGYNGTPNTTAAASTGSFACAPPAPASIASSCSADGASVTFNWPASSGATGYYPSIQGPSSCASGWTQSAANTCTQSNVSGTSATYSGITPGTTYTASVQAGSNGTVSTNATANGTSFSCVPSNPATLSYVCAPSGTSVTLNWSAATGATGYYPHVGGLSSCASGWTFSSPSTCSQSNVSGTSITYSGITPGATYNAWVNSGAGGAVNTGATAATINSFSCLPPPVVSCTPSVTSTVAGNLVTWTATPSGGNGTYTYSWSGTPSVTGTTQSISPTYTTAGTASASVTVTSAGASSASTPCSSTVAVSAAPTVTCIPSATSIIAGTPVTWTATPSGGNGTYTYSWSGTPSVSGTTQSISPTYTTPTTATAAVTVTSGGISSAPTTCSSSVTVNAVPTANISVSPTSVIAGNSTTITWSSTNATSCTGTNFNTAGYTSGTLSVTPTNTTTYGLSCTGPGGTTTGSATVTVGCTGGQILQTNGTCACPTNQVLVGGVCTIPADLTAGGVTPTTATVNIPVTLSAPVSNGGSGATGGSFTDLFEINPTSLPATFASIATLQTYSSAALAANASNTASISYAFPTAGTYYVRVCANTDTSDNNIVTESNYGNNCGSWTTVTVAPPPLPVPVLTASPSTIIAGANSTLTWSSTNATACTGTNFNTANHTSGSMTVTPAATITYSISCTGPGGTANTSATVTVNTPPTTTLTATPGSVTAGGASTLAWSSTNATVCTGSGFSTGNYTSGTASVSPATTTSYSVTCTGPGGTHTSSATVIVNGLVGASLSASPTNITPGGNSTLTWSSSNATVCAGAGFSTGNYTSGTASVAPATTTAYGVVCTGAAGVGTANAVVTVSGPPTATLTASPTSIVLGGSSTLTWSSTNTTACTGTGFSTGTYTGGTASVAPATTTTYSVSCTGPGGTISKTAVVAVQLLPDLTASTVPQTGATADATTALTAVVQNGGNGGTSGPFPVLFEINPDSIPSSLDTIATLLTYTSPTLAAGANNTASVSYTFPTAGTYYVRACANMDTSGTNIVTESNYGNNCSGLWTQVTVTNSSSCTGGQTLQADGTCACPSGQSLVGGTCATNAVSDLTAGSVIPAAATTNVATTFSTPITNGGTGDTTSGFPVLFEINSGSIPADFASISQLKTYDSPTLTAGSSDTASISYTFPTAGTYYMRACANVNTSGINIVTESDYGNNCGAWTQVTVTDSSCIGGQTLQADGTCACPSGQSLVGGTCAPTCTGGQTLQSDGTCACPSGQSLDASGSCAVTCPAQRLCTSAANICGMTNTGSSQCDGTCTLSTPPDSSCAPQLTLIADRTHVAAGATTTITYAAQYVTSCTFTSPDGTATDLPVVNGMVATSTVVTAPVNSSQTYKLTCDGVSVQVVIGLLPSFHEN